MNGSFEQNGHTISDITAEAPLYWCDVDIPEDKFLGKVTGDSWTHRVDSLSLELRFERFQSIEKGDTAVISQQVFIEDDVNDISFNLLLWGLNNGNWGAGEQTALVMIDNTVIWDSNAVPLDPPGKFDGTVYIGSENFQQFLDNDRHKLSFAVRSNIDDSSINDWYVARWDFVKFDKYCGGFGYLTTDLNQDCYVDLEDFSELALQWLDAPDKPKCDLVEDGIINILDLQVLVEDWLYNTDWTKWGEDGTFEMARLEADLDLSGEVDLPDLMILAENWLGESACDLPDLNGDDYFDMYDYAILAGQWGLRDWIYYRDQ
ncbi:MAG: hypothetical protein JW804_04215 [Sedimentisphaerales bacterium]|nr:hypothetical protein [Sedimentisphaerales bacterium]